MGALVIPIQHLDTHGKDYVFALDQVWLDQAFQGTGVRGDASGGQGAVEVHAQRNGSEILVHGRARARLVAECGRCLKDLPLEVACDLAALYAPQQGAAHGHHDAEDEELEALDAEEPDREHYSGDEVVIDGLVRDYLLLELPMQPRCELGWECPNLDLPEHMRGAEGVHSAAVHDSDKTSGADIDPRLMPLMKLAKREPDKE
jgi:uncharacterized metal-binding protein YceD (DUF177 family)